MTDIQIFNALFDGGKFTKPYLIKFTNKTSDVIRLVNDNQIFLYQGETYKPASFEYTQPNNTGLGATLSISSIPNENNIFEFIENLNDKYRLDVVGVINAAGDVQPIKQYVHFYGNVTADEKGTLNFNLGSDDRWDMNFTSYKYDTDNNKGNA